MATDRHKEMEGGGLPSAELDAQQTASPHETHEFEWAYNMRDFRNLAPGVCVCGDGKNFHLPQVENEDMPNTPLPIEKLLVLALTEEAVKIGYGRYKWTHESVFTYSSIPLSDTNVESWERMTPAAKLHQVTNQQLPSGVWVMPLALGPSEPQYNASGNRSTKSSAYEQLPKEITMLLLKYEGGRAWLHFNTDYEQRGMHWYENNAEITGGWSELNRLIFGLSHQSKWGESAYETAEPIPDESAEDVEMIG